MFFVFDCRRSLILLATSCSTSTTVLEIPEEALASTAPSCPARFAPAVFLLDLPGSGTGVVKITILWSRWFYFEGVHQSDLGGFSSGRRRRSRWECPRHTNGGLWGLPSWIFLRLLPGHLPDSKQPVRKNGFSHQRAITIS